MAAPFRLAFINGKEFELPRPPVAEEVTRCIEFIQAVEQLPPRATIAFDASNPRRKKTRLQIWKAGGYAMKHYVENWKLPYIGYISTESLVFAAVLCGAGIRGYSSVPLRHLVDVEFVAPKRGEQS